MLGFIAYSYPYSVFENQDVKLREKIACPHLFKADVRAANTSFDSLTLTCSFTFLDISH